MLATDGGFSDMSRLRYSATAMTALVRKPKKSTEWRDTYYHKLLGLKAAQEVDRLLPIFEKERPNDTRPRNAAEAIRAWAEGHRHLGMAEVRKLSLAAHAAAKSVKSRAAKHVAHAAGHAIGTWHVPTHALAAFGYAGRAIAEREFLKGEKKK